MALPTAPLGQLPNMNMPYNIPTYEKGPKLWERALVSFLSGVATQAGQGAVSNLMSKDYGDKPTGVLRKLVEGPSVSREEHDRQLAQEFQKSQQERQLTADAKNTASRERLALNESADRSAEAALDRQLRERLALNASTDQQWNAQDEHANRLAEIAAQVQGQKDLRALVPVDSPSEARLRSAQAANLESETAQRAMYSDMLKRQMGGGGAQVGGSPQVTDADRAAAQAVRNGNTAVPIDQLYPVGTQQPTTSQVGQFTFQQPAGNPFAEIMARVQAEEAANTGASAQPTTPTDTAVSPEQQAVAEFLAGAAARDPALVQGNPDAVARHLAELAATFTKKPKPTWAPMQP